MRKHNNIPLFFSRVAPFSGALWRALFTVMITMFAALSCDQLTLNEEPLTQPPETPAPHAYLLHITGLPQGDAFVLTATTQEKQASIAIESPGSEPFEIELWQTELEPLLAQPGVSLRASALPAGYECTLSENQSASIINATLLSLSCETLPKYKIDGILRGLKGTDLKVRLFLPSGDTEDTSLSQNGSFLFKRDVRGGFPFRAEIIAQPYNPVQHCLIEEPEQISGPKNNVFIDCSERIYTLTGRISGHNHRVTLLARSGSPKRTEKITVDPSSGYFLFTHRLAASENYEVSVNSTSPEEACLVTNGRGVAESDVASVIIECSMARKIKGSIQNTTDLKGEITVLLYRNPENFLFPEKEILIKNPGKSNKTSFEMTLPSGSYYLRAFADTNNDSLPSLGQDPQSQLAGPILLESFDALGTNLVLYDTTDAARWQGFNAYLYNEPPWRPTGGGSCGGYRLQLEITQPTGDLRHLEYPSVMLPDGTSYYLHDDGGCSLNGSNLWYSYDDQKLDGNFNLGLARKEPLASDAGAYFFYYRNLYKDFIHIARDDIKTPLKLSTHLSLSHPTGQRALDELSPLISWPPIQNALGYRIEIKSTHGLYHNLGDPAAWTSYNYYTPLGSRRLLDIKSYQAIIYAFDTDLSAAPFKDFDAASRGAPNYFITDTTGASSITISGSLENLSGVEGAYIIHAASPEGRSSIYLDAHSPGYRIAMLRSENGGSLSTSIDRDGSGLLNSPANRSFLRKANGLDLRNDVALPLSWPAPVTLLLPPGGERTGFSPQFTWAPYIMPSSKKITRWSYLLIAKEQGLDYPPTIAWGLPMTTTSWRIGDAPPAEPLSENRSFDLTAMLNCLDAGGKWNDASQSCSQEARRSQNDLSTAKTWEWSVAVVECDFELHLLQIDANTNGLGDYSECLLNIISGEKSAWALSESRLLYP